jgi:2-isopropylmalate synthase
MSRSHFGENMDIQLYDTTLRDGSQGEGVNFSLQDKLLITGMLDEIGFDFVEGGFPASNEKDFEYFQQVAEGVPGGPNGGLRPLTHAKVVAFGMTRRKGIDASQDAGLQALVASKAPVCTIVGKTSDLHVTEVLRVSLEENLAMIRDSIAYLRSENRRVFYDAEHFFDGYRANPEYALKTIAAAIEGGAEMVVFCDTNGGSLPERIAETILAVKPHVTVPFGVHCHNDCDMAVANSLMAVDCGALQVQGTINGIGERCGNVDLISVAANLAVKKQGYRVLREDGVRRLTELSRYVYEMANMNFRNGQPFVGRSAFAHKGGMHVHAVNRFASSYEHIAPEVVGNERRILVSELSGRSNIVAKMNRYNIDADDALMKRILERVVELEGQGYQFEAAEASFALLVKKVAGQYEPRFRRLHYHVFVQVDDGAAGDSEAASVPVTQASVKVQIGGRTELVAGEGDGPVNALDTALRKALLPAYPNLSTMRLVDYKVRVINSMEGTAARVRVVIESADENEVWSTVGVSENVIEASWQALVDAVDYKLFKDEGSFRTAAEAPLAT